MMRKVTGKTTTMTTRVKNMMMTTRVKNITTSMRESASSPRPTQKSSQSKAFLILTTHS